MTAVDALVAKAAQGRRVRGFGVALWEAMRRAPDRAGPTLRRGLRQARALHSVERRLMQEALYGLVRRGEALQAVLGTDDPVVLWLAWLVLERDLPPELAAAERSEPDWAGLADRIAALDPATRSGLPAWVVGELRATLRADDEVAAFLAACDVRAPVTLRANRRRCTAEALRVRLAADGIATEPVPGLPDGLRAGRADVEGTAAFREGWFEVQDAGSQRVAAAVGGGPVLDVCAGAGGKALALAARGLQVTALDVRQRALDELALRAKRAGVRVTRRLVGEDPRQWPADLPRVPWALVDAPCSGSGVLRRHPEHRWQLEPARVADRAALQGALLARAAAQVVPGGAVVYATCSVLRTENEDVVDAFLAGHPGWRLGETLRTWPHRDDCDGFYVATVHAPG